MLAPDARTLRTCVTDGRPYGSLFHPIVVQQAVVGGIEGQPFPIYDHVEPVVQLGVARGWDLQT
jgi:hypothetical protein